VQRCMGLTEATQFRLKQPKFMAVQPVL